MNATTLPLLNLAHYFNPAERDAFLEQLRTSARDIGFFYLINHGVNDDLQRAVQREARRFFALSDTQKQQVAMIHSPIFAATTVRHRKSPVANRTGANSSISVLKGRHCC